jgi:hypothetical protein
MALRATVERDLPRQDLGTYQEDGDGAEIFLWSTRVEPATETTDIE